MSLESEIEFELKRGGAEIISFVDISPLPRKKNRGFPSAILLGISLSPEYIQILSSTPEYIQQMHASNQINEDEFHAKERITDKLADNLTVYLSAQGYSAFSQSENNLGLTGNFNEETKHSPLPHKTIAGLAGLGWIGKHNLLVSPEYGSAISMCTVLTDAPLQTVAHASPISKCGDCSLCIDICTAGALKGTTWDTETSRDELLDVHHCTSCLRCLALCPWTQKYMKDNMP